MDKQDLQKAFEDFEDNFKKQDSCSITEESIDYPSYTDALYAKLLAPSQSGIYISRWDLKVIALNAGESIAIGPRKRMFELLMKFAASRENMELLLQALQSHIEDTIVHYEELQEQYPATAFVFEKKISQAKGVIAFFPRILKEYF